MERNPRSPLGHAVFILFYACHWTPPPAVTDGLAPAVDSLPPRLSPSPQGEKISRVQYTEYFMSRVAAQRKERRRDGESSGALPSRTGRNTEEPRLSWTRESRG